MTSKRIYLDYASATPLDERVEQAMKPYWRDIFYNASAIYEGGIEAKKHLTAARLTIAKSFGSKPAEVVFTSGGSESNNLAVHGIMQCFDGANMLASEIEHDSILKPAEKYSHKIIKVDKIGRILLDDLAKKIDDKTVLVSVQLANNEIGTIQPIKKISSLIDEIRKNRLERGIKLPIYLHTDACQALNYVDINAARLGVDLISVNGGKIYGPKGSGALFVRAGIKLMPIIEGGGQELGYRSGTENLAGATGLAEALKITQAMRDDEVKRIGGLNDYFKKTVARTIPLATYNGPAKNRLPNNLNFTFTGIDNERLIMRLDMLGIACSAGSACSASSESPSHVLRAIGLTDEAARSSLRFSIGRQTTKKDIDIAIKFLAQSIELEQ